MYCKTISFLTILIELSLFKSTFGAVSKDLQSLQKFDIRNLRIPLQNTTLEYSRAGTLLNSFLASIRYWDFDEIKEMPASVKEDMKQSILREFLRHEEISVNDACICTRILLPFVCDSNGQLHSNICRFHCRRSKGSGIEDIRPTMILTETSFQKSKELCQTRFGVLNNLE